MRHINRDCRTIGNMVESHGSKISRLEEIAGKSPCLTRIGKLERQKQQIDTYNAILSHWGGNFSEIEAGRRYAESLEKKLDEVVESYAEKIQSKFERAEADWEMGDALSHYRRLKSFFDYVEIAELEEYEAPGQRKREPCCRRTESSSQNPVPGIQQPVTSSQFPESSSQQPADSSRQHSGAGRIAGFVGGIAKAAAGIAIGFALFSAYRAFTAPAHAYEPQAENTARFGARSAQHYLLGEYYLGNGENENALKHFRASKECD